VDVDGIGGGGGEVSELLGACSGEYSGPAELALGGEAREGDILASNWAAEDGEAAAETLRGVRGFWGLEVGNVEGEKAAAVGLVKSKLGCQGGYSDRVEPDGYDVCARWVEAERGGT
jgi:hypothetical protein